MKKPNNCSSSSKEYTFCISSHSRDKASKKKAVNFKYNLNLNSYLAEFAN